MCKTHFRNTFSGTCRKKAETLGRTPDGPNVLCVYSSSNSCVAASAAWLTDCVKFVLLDSRSCMVMAPWPCSTMFLHAPTVILVVCLVMSWCCPLLHQCTAMCSTRYCAIELICPSAQTMSLHSHVQDGYMSYPSSSYTHVQNCIIRLP